MLHVFLLEWRNFSSTALDIITVFLRTLINNSSKSKKIKIN